MRAMILAAGRGKRMGKITEQLPKPLLRVGNYYLIEYALFKLKQAGIQDVVINVSYHAEQIEAALGDGKRYGMNILYSKERERLETGGGIFKALPLLGNNPFLVMSCDIITDFPIQNLMRDLNNVAHLIMVKNPPYHLRGDFGLNGDKIAIVATPTFTFANVGLYHPALFAGCIPGHFNLASLLLPAISAGKVTGELYEGLWYNVGTAEDLAEVNLRVLAFKPQISF